MPFRRFFLLCFLSFIVHPTLGQGEQESVRLYFESDQDELLPDEAAKLERLWEIVKSDSITKIFIVGHTDSKADSLYNINLSKRRCDYVSSFFIQNTIDRALIKTTYHGENKPVAENDTEVGLQENRRVDVRVNYEPYNIMQETQPREERVLDPCVGKDTTLVLGNGTEITFNTCEFLEIKDCLTIHTVLTPEELRNSTLGLLDENNEPLVSCGMIRLCLDDSCAGKVCFDEPITIRFPFPSEEDCVPCMTRFSRFYNINSDGSWTESKNRKDKIKVVEIDGKQFYELSIKCPDCSFKNCDCKTCAQMKKGEKRRNCPDVKLKLPAGYQLVDASIYIDCPTTRLYFQPDTLRFIKRRNIGITQSRCYEGEKLIEVKALNPSGDTVYVQLQPLENIRHKILLSKCKLKQKDEQKVLGFLPGRKRLVYRKYRVRERDFEE